MTKLALYYVLHAVFSHKLLRVYIISSLLCFLLSHPDSYQKRWGNLIDSIKYVSDIFSILLMDIEMIVDQA